MASIVKCVFIGPKGVGKSTVFDLLVHAQVLVRKQDNISLRTEDVKAKSDQHEDLWFQIWDTPIHERIDMAAIALKGSHLAVVVYNNEQSLEQAKHYQLADPSMPVLYLFNRTPGVDPGNAENLGREHARATGNHFHALEPVDDVALTRNKLAGAMLAAAKPPTLNAFQKPQSSLQESKRLYLEAFQRKIQANPNQYKHGISRWNILVPFMLLCSPISKLPKTLQMVRDMDLSTNKLVEENFTKLEARLKVGCFSRREKTQDLYTKESANMQRILDLTA